MRQGEGFAFETLTLKPHSVLKEKQPDLHPPVAGDPLFPGKEGGRDQRDLSGLVFRTLVPSSSGSWLLRLIGSGPKRVGDCSTTRKT